MTGLRDIAILALRSAAFEFLAAGLLFSGCGVARRFAGPCRASARWSLAVLATLVIATMTFHVLAAAGIFNLYVALAAVAAIAAVVHLRVQPAGECVAEVARDIRVALEYLCAGRRDVRAWVLAALSAAALVTVSKTLLIPPLGWDALTYHCTKAALWIQNGTLETLRAPGGWSYFPMFSGGGEIVLAWAMLPFHSDLLVAFSGTAIWLATGLATFGLGRTLGLSRWVGASAALFVLFVPAMHRITGAGYVEPCLTLVTLLMLLAALLYFDSRKPFFLVAALAAAGLMVGTKIMGLVLGGVGSLLLLAGVVSDSRNRREHLRMYAVGSALALIAVAPWWARAVAQTGYPLSPVPLTIAGVTLGRINPDLAWLQVRPDTVSTWAREWEMVRMLFVWDAGTPRLGPAMVVPLALALPGLLLVARRRKWPAAFAAAMIAAFVAAYFHPGMKVIRLNWETTNARYFIQVLPVIVVFSCAAFGPSRRVAAGYGWILAGLAAWNVARESLWGVSGITLRIVPFVALAAVVGLSGLLCCVRRGRGGYALAAAVLGPLVCLPALSVYRDATRAEVFADEHTMALHSTLRYWSDAAAAVDVPGCAARVAVTSAPWQNGDNWLLFPFLGRRLQNRVLYVPISAAGSIPSFDGTERYLDDVSPQAWLARLHELGITHVMSFWPRSVEQIWMAANPELFEPVSVGEKWGFYRVRR